jgi:hypothetical protein
MFGFKGESLTVKVARYQYPAAMAVVLECADGQPYCTLSTNLPELPAEGCFWLKDWSENTPVVEHMLKNKAIELTGRTLPSGFVLVREARLKIPAKELVP